MKYGAVLFDLDGTLLDTIDDLTDSMKAALGQLGLPPRTAAECKLSVGEGVETEQLPYIILSGDTRMVLEALVRTSMQVGGYVPTGGVCVIESSSEEPRLLQAMVLPGGDDD